MTRVKSVFKFGADNDLLDKTVKFGSEFKKPDQAVFRRHRAKGGEKLFTPDEVKALAFGAMLPGGDDGPELLRADPAMRAMVLLGINAGLGNTDVAALPLSALDLKHGWLNFPRPKTSIARRCPLWPETVAAIREAIATRPKPADYPECGLAFVTPEGHAWVRFRGKSNTDRVAVEFAKLVKRLRPESDGLGFYGLRHTFRTVADATSDQPAADHIMGHTDPSMRGHYVERLDDARLKAVTDHVRAWLWPKVGAAGEAS